MLAVLQAHRAGSVTSLCRTPWGDLWTGTSRGWIRIWECADAGAFADSAEYALPMREIRRSGGARPHAGGVAHMVCPAGGQVCPDLSTEQTEWRAVALMTADDSWPLLHTVRECVWDSACTLESAAWKIHIILPTGEHCDDF